MFTGLVAEMGKIQELQWEAGMIHLSIAAPRLRKTDMKIGDSVAINGICLTVIELDDFGFKIQVMPETVAKTTLANWKVGDAVNLERALNLSGRLDGHLVSGHVDGVAQIVSLIPAGASRYMELEVEAELSRFIAQKGSVTLDGVSLTVAKIVSENRFSVALIPHTLASTTLGNMIPGARLNIEVDIIVRYLERLSQSRIQSGLTLEQLAEKGFL